MPFVYTCPPPKTILNVSDSIYVYGNPKDVQNLEKILNLPFVKQGNMTHLGKLSLLCSSSDLTAPPSAADENLKRRRSMAGSLATGGAGGATTAAAAAAAAAAAFAASAGN